MAAVEVSTTELGKHKSREDIWMAIHGNVYNLSEFIEEHPGGPEILLEQAGMDATVAFDDIGHSDNARELMRDFLVGPLVEHKKVDVKSSFKAASPPPKATASMFLAKWAPIAVTGAIIAGFIAYHYSR